MSRTFFPCISVSEKKITGLLSDSDRIKYLYYRCILATHNEESVIKACSTLVHNDIKVRFTHGFILDGCLFHVAHE